MTLPKLFIGSSSENLLMVEVLVEKLGPYAKVVPWTDQSVFLPTDFYLQSLLRLPSRFDFGLFLLEPDDIVTSRGSVADVPRDNVIFELGLFMSQLGTKRVLAMAPRGRVRLLSDINGFKPIEYAEPVELRELRTQLGETKNETTRRALSAAVREKLRVAMEPAVAVVIELLRAGPVLSGVSADEPNVIRVAQTVEKLVKLAVDEFGSASVLHLGLDMSEAWGILTNEILHEEKKLEGVAWRCLMIDPESQEIQRASSMSVRVDIAAQRIIQIRELLDKDADRLKERRIKVECKAYSALPTMHGFLIEKKALLWSMCDIRDGKLDASLTPYWRFDVADEPGQTVRSFGHWFEYQWETARPIWVLENRQS